MKKRIMVGSLSAALVLGFGLVVFCHLAACKKLDPVKALPQEKLVLLEAADEDFDKHNYRRAIEAYERILADEAGYHHEPVIRLKLAAAHYQLEEFIEAAVAAEKLLELAPTPIIKARAHHLLANAYFRRPHWGYELDGVIYHHERPEGSRYVNTEAADLKAADSHFAAALNLYKEAAGQIEGAAREAVTLLFDFAQFQEIFMNSGQAVSLLFEARKSVEPPAGMGMAWTVGEKMEAIYDELEKLALVDEDAEMAALARYRKGFFFLSYYDSWYWRRIPGQYSSKGRGAKPDWYKALDENRIHGLETLKLFFDDYPGSASAPEVRFTIAMYLQDKATDYLGAEKQFERLIADHPDSKWAEDSKHYLQQMRAARLDVGQNQPALPDTQVTLQIRARNISDVSVEAYRLDLPAFLEQVGRTHESGNWLNITSDERAAVEEHSGEQVFVRHVAVEDKGDRQWVQTELAAPLGMTGAYWIKAVGGDGEVESHGVVLVSDLVILKKVFKDHVMLFVTDAFKGEPAPGARILLKEQYYDSGAGKHITALHEGETDHDGVFAFHIDRAAGRGSFQYQALAVSGPNYAVTNFQSGRWYASDSVYKVYAVTDRPVYRPEHTVHYKLTFRAMDQGDYAVLGEERVRVRITDPRGEEVEVRELVTDRYGAVWGEFTLGEEPPLGGYQVRGELLESGGRSHWGSAQYYFRVEEYRKPEFILEVKPGSRQVRKGDAASAVINVKYFFGAPVVGGEVEYRVFREVYYHWWRSRGEFDWFYDLEPETHYGRGSERGAVVAEGKGFTDEQGNLSIEFPTEVGDPRYDYNYRINIKATDQSRRTIEGSGSIKATRTQFFAFVNGDRHLYRRGDQIQFEINTLTPDNFPVSTEGAIEVVELVWSDVKKEYVEGETVHRGNVYTDENGKGFHAWKSAANGLFRVRFKTMDAWEQTVEGVTSIWVADESFTGARHRFQDIEIITDKRVYQPGETALLMVSSRHQGGHVLMVEEAGFEFLGRTVVPLNGNAGFYRLEVTTAHVPNFFLCAYLIRDGITYRQEKQMYVAPVQRFMNISVTPDKDKYGPGESGTFRIRATDHQGEPVRAQLSFAAVDSSIYYIQTETAEDPRKFFFWERRASSLWNFHTSYANRFSGFDLDNQEYEYYETHGAPPGWNWAYVRKKYFLADAMTTYGVLVFDADALRRELEDEEAALEAGRHEGPMDAFGAPYDARRYKTAGVAADFESTGAPPPPMMAAAPEPMAERAMAADRAVLDMEEDAAVDFVDAEVRARFEDTAFWAPDIETDDRGEAVVEFAFPDNLTTWALQSRGISIDTKAGRDTTEVITTKDLIVRLLAPRFFVQRDEILVSAMVHNYLDADKQVKVMIELPDQLKPLGEDLERIVTVPRNGQLRLDWMVRVVEIGEAEITVKALTDTESDAVRLSFPVFIHGVEKFQAFSGSLIEEDAFALMLDVPAQREAGSGSLVLTLSPSLAGAMLDAIPYLIRYPYGCTEQTVSRFLPAVLVRKTLSELGVDLDQIRDRREKLASLEHSASALYWDETVNPVYDEDVLDAVIADGLKRLYDFQHDDGGWGWWKGDGSSAYMTSYVVMGLQLARDAGVEADPAVINRGLAWLRARLPREEHIHSRLFMVNAMSFSTDKLAEDDLDPFFVRRDDLNDYERALLALSYHRIGVADKAGILVENMENYVKVDEENRTAHWGGKPDYWWFWNWDPIETNAMTLNAMANIDPGNRLAGYLVKWIVNNRTGKRWKSTRDTAMVVYAMCDYIRENAEFDVELTVTVSYGDEIVKGFEITRDTVFSFDNKLIVPDAELVAGEVPLRIQKQGRGNLYWSAELVYFTLEDDIKGAGNEIFVNRKYYKLTPRVEEDARGTPRLTYDRTPIPYLSAIVSGDEVEVSLTIDSRNNYEYVVIEDYKPSGFEPIELKSGYSWLGGLGAYMELRDEKTAFFIGWLPQGVHEISYKLRAEVPGRLRVMPTAAHAMYAPSVRAISDGFRVEVTDKP